MASIIFEIRVSFNKYRHNNNTYYHVDYERTTVNNDDADDNPLASGRTPNSTETIEYYDKLYRHGELSLVCGKYLELKRELRQKKGSS